MKSLIVCSLIIGLAATTTGSAQTIITPICTDAAFQDAPAISGNRIM
jgi:hypothetical protein